MLIDREKIEEAKEKLGDRNAEIMAEVLHLEKFDTKNLKSLCPFHLEDSGSFVYNPKGYYFKCFGCGQTTDIIEAYMRGGFTFVEACKKLFEHAAIKYSFGEHNIKTKAQYVYPAQTPLNDKTNVYSYLEKRGISKEVVDYCDVREDEHGNCVFNYYDTNDVLTTVKYRPSHAINKASGELKTWCQKGAGTTQLLFNMNKINPTQPLLISEGECFLRETELFSKDGWIKIEEYSGQEVLQVNQDGTSEFVLPTAYIKKEYSGDIFNYNVGGNYSLTTTPGHNWAYIDNDGNIAKQKADELVVRPIANGTKFPTVCNLNCNGIDMSNDTIALYLAISADGSIHELKNSETDNSFIIRLKKKRKIDRLESLLSSLNIEYKCIVDKYDVYNFRFRLPKMFKKDLPIEFVTKTTIEQKNFILEEMVYWDGNRVQNRTQVEYSSKLIHNVTVMQAIAHTCGHMATIIPRSNEFGSWYKLSVLNKSYVTYNKKNLTKTTHNGLVYCVTVPSGMIMIRHNLKICVSGNCDALAAIQSGYFNTVSVPFGANNYQWIEENWEWLEQFASIIIASDNDDAGKKMQKECIFRLGSWRTKIMDIPDEYIDEEDGSRYPINDINEFMYIAGSEAVMDAIINAKDTPVDSLIDFSDIQEVDLSQIDGIYTGIEEFDREMMRLFYGTFNILTGINGSGKSSFLHQIIAQSLEQNKDVWLYSKELPNYMSKNWQDYIFAGVRNINEYVTERGAKYHKVTEEAKKQIDDYYRGHLKIYKDGWDNTVEDIQKSMIDSARKFGSKLFIIDNLTAINFKCGDNDKWTKQVDLVNWCIDFAQKYHVVVILVIHPKKIEMMRRLSKLDVAGLGSIVDLAHRLISLYRVQPKEKQGSKKQNGTGFAVEPVKYDVILDVLKDRMRGRENMSVGLYYDVPSRRFYTNKEEYGFNYKWDKRQYNDDLIYPQDLIEEEVFGVI